MKLELTDDEAFVLAGFLARLERVVEASGAGAGELHSMFENKAEELVLWRVQAQLEKSIDCLFSDQSEALYQQAVANVHRAFYGP